MEEIQRHKQQGNSEPMTSSVEMNDLGNNPVTVQPTSKHLRLPRYNHNGHLVTRGIHPDGESGRKGWHPWKFLKICVRSSSMVSKFVNVLWPFVPAAIAVHFARPDAHMWVFALNYVAMVPTANLIGFAGQELARKLPKVLGEYSFYGSELLVRMLIPTRSTA